jgi:phage-related baseplate assembly protein
MALSVEQLIEQVSKEVALTTLISILDALGFPATSWQSGSIQRTLLEMHAELYEEISLVVTDIAKAGFNSTSTGGWLTLLADSHYDNQRGEGVKTRGPCELADAQQTGPHTIDIGEMVVSDAAGHRYRNITAGVLPAAGALTGGDALIFEAELVGTDYNIANGEITIVVEGPPGVTVNNPDPGSGSWRTQEGADAETDAALQRRDQTKWATLTKAPPADAYEFWARAADQSVTRVYIDDENPRGPGTLDVYIAGADGALTGPDTTPSTVAYIVRQYIEDGRRAINDDVMVVSAVDSEVTMTGTVYCLPSADLDDIEAKVSAAIAAYFKSVPIGGVRSDSVSIGAFLLGGLYAAIFSVTGVVNVALSAPLADVVLANNEVAIPNLPLGLTFEFAAF